MVVCYTYVKQERRQQQVNVPPSRAILMSMQQVGAMRMAGLDAMCPGLNQKPLDAAIG
jgi:hypothetical protein